MRRGMPELVRGMKAVIRAVSYTHLDVYKRQAYTYDGDGNIRTLETRAGEAVLLSFAYRYRCV